MTTAPKVSNLKLNSLSSPYRFHDANGVTMHESAAWQVLESDNPLYGKGDMLDRVTVEGLVASKDWKVSIVKV